MKKFIALIAVLGMGPAAFAAEGADLTWNGEYRLKYSNVQDADFNSDAGDRDQSWDQRVRLGLTARAGEKTTFNALFVHNTEFGDNADQIPGGDSTAAGMENNTLVVNEAGISWMLRENLMLRAGRGSATLANGKVVSDNDYDAVKRAFDGAMLAWMHEKVDLKTFAVWGATGDTANSIGRFFGVAADFKGLPEFIKNTHLHYVMVKRDEASYTINGAATALPKEDTSRIGLTLGGEASIVDYSLTYAMYSGETETAGTTTDVDTSMMDLEVGFKFPAAMNMRAHLGYHTDSGLDDSGDNTKYTGFHYDTHNNAGLMDFLGWGNLTYMRAGFSMNPSDDLTVALEYLMFTQTEEDDSSVGIDGSTAVVDTDDEDALGSEIDLSVSKKYSNNFTTTASYRMFTPGDEFGTDADNMSQMYLEAKLTF